VVHGQDLRQDDTRIVAAAATAALAELEFVAAPSSRTITSRHNKRHNKDETPEPVSRLARCGSGSGTRS
jgi:mevalonate pyrophosphate decarboxylase